MCGYVVVLLWFCHPEAGLMVRSGLLLSTLFSAPVNPVLIYMRLVFWTLYVCMYVSKIPLWVNKHAWPVDVVYLYLGCRNQRQDSDPRHGVPLWGGHAGYQAGVSAAVREVTVHCHLCTSHTHMYNTLHNPYALFTYVTLEHKTSLKSLGYICSNSQKYIVCVKIIDFSFMPKIIRILSKDEVNFKLK